VKGKVPKVVGRRLVMALPLLFTVSALSLFLVSLTPGDAAQQILGLNAPADAYPKLREALGLDRPFHEQYSRWASDAVRGDMGTSLFTGEPVSHAINVRLPVTVALMGGALALSLVLGVGLGMFSAIRGGVLGRVVDALALAGFAFPVFWIGALLVLLFSVRLSWLPATGYVEPAESPAGWVRSLTLPVIALALGGIAAMAKQTREAMLDVLGSEYIRMCWANGTAAWSVYCRHALKNAGARVATILGLQAVSLLGGTVVVETLFALPGMGSLAVTASLNHDLPLIQGVVVYFTLIVVAVNLVIDLAYSWLNPRVRVS
jgi:peptide/nickel transport system permease protein